MPTRSPYSTRFKLVASAIVAVAAIGFYVAYRTTTSDDSSGLTQTGGPDGEGGGDGARGTGADGTPGYIERLIPAGGSEVLQQQTIGVDLAPGWDAALSLNNVEIPDDELDRTPALSLIEYEPGEGKTVPALATGANCAEAEVWSLAAGRDAARRVQWCFEVA